MTTMKQSGTTMTSSFPPLCMLQQIECYRCESVHLIVEHDNSPVALIHLEGRSKLARVWIAITSRPSHTIVNGNPIFAKEIKEFKQRNELKCN